MFQVLQVDNRTAAKKYINNEETFINTGRCYKQLLPLYNYALM